MKKHVSKMIAAVLAGAILAGSAMTTTASASSIVGDVNGDGKIDITDAVTLNKYLAGKCELTDLTAPDTNANYLIDKVDSEILMKFLVHSITTLPYTG